MSQNARLLCHLSSGNSVTQLGVYRALDRRRENGITMYLCECPFCNSRAWRQKETAARSKSCGCKTKEILRNARTIHGHSHLGGGNGTPTYLSWLSMIDRCCYEKHKSFNDYGGRGIVVCDRWREFANFLADMGERPDGTTLGRKDNDGNYEPNNCAWQSHKHQARNRRSNRFIMYDGKNLTLAEWSEVVKIPRDTLWRRLDNGWSVANAFTDPIRAWKNATVTRYSLLSEPFITRI